MNKGIGILVVLLTLGGLGLFFWNQEGDVNTPVQNEKLQATPTAKVLNSETFSTPIPTLEREASFAIFTKGTFRVFTAAMYHNLSKDVYIDARNPNKVQVKKANITWNDFFATLPFKLNTECLVTGTKETFCTGSKGKLQFYLNGEKNSDPLGQEIAENDKLLVTFGNENEAQIKRQIDRVP